MSVEQLGAALAPATSPQRIRLIAIELSSRGPDATPVLKEYSRTRKANDPATRMVLANIEIALARIGRTDTDYVKSLENMLSAGDIYAIDAAAWELEQIGSAEAIAALKSHERGGRPRIKIARLRAEYGKLPAERRVAAILESARLAIREHEGNDVPALVAERSSLRENAEPFIKKELEAVSSQPQDAVGQRYRAFLEGVLQDLQRARVMRQTTTTLPIATMPAPTSAFPVPTSPRDLDKQSTVPASQSVLPRADAAVPSTRPTSPPSRPAHVVAPEDRGEDFSAKPVDELLSVLGHSQDIVALRKAAKALGDRQLAGSLKLSEEQRAVLQRYIEESLLADVASKDAAKRSEANAQIQRLWRLAGPVLVRHIDDGNLTVVEACSKNLILMRDENLISSLIEKTRESQGQAKLLGVICLGKMTERRESQIPGRTCLAAEESMEIANRLIKPFLLEVQQSGDGETKILVQRALQELERQTPAGVWVRTTAPAQRQ